MNKKIRAFFITLLLASLICLPVGNAWADMGGFSGANDFSSDWGSSDWGSSDWGSTDWSSGWESSDWGSDYSDNFEYYDGDSDFGFGAYAAILFIILVILFMKMPSKKGTGKAPIRIEDSFDKSKLRNMKDLKNVDLGKMAYMIGDWYVKMQNAWTAKDMSGLRNMFTDALFSQFDNQLDSLRNRKQTNFVEDIKIEGVEFEGWYEEGDELFVTARVKAAIIDYTVSDENGRLVSGSKSDVKHMTYRWVLSRSKDMTTANGMAVVSCPNCGAALQINQTSKCPYCDSIVTLKSHDWVITSIQGLEQRTEKR